jgi:RNA 2',3'-cyclic 3'-phosphodiesterase
MSSPGTRSRLFVALALPDEVRAPLARYLAQCAELAPDQRWAPAVNLHLTLHFLGWVEPEAMTRVAAALEGVRRPAFKLELGALGRFGTAARPRVLWIGVAGGREPLAALAAEVARASREAGVVGDERPYNPHLTLCRVRSGARLPALPEPPPPLAWKARSFTLFQSRPGPRGSVYVPLQAYRLTHLGGGVGDRE